LLSLKQSVVSIQPLTLGARRGHLAAGLRALEAARLNQIVAARTRVPDVLAVGRRG